MNKIPKILLIGAGKFGINHLRVLTELEKANKLVLKGIVVKTKKSAISLEKKYKVKTYTKFSTNLIKSVDAVQIVTPAATHFNLVNRFLNYTNVFVEKPLALKHKEALSLVKKAKTRNKVLFVGHIFRYHPMIKKLKEIIKPNLKSLYFIEGKYSGKSVPNNDSGATITYLHLFDIVDFLLEKEPLSVYATKSNPIRPDSKYEDEAKIICNYGKNLSAFFEVGWVGVKKQRILNLHFTTMNIYCDLINTKIEVETNSKKKIYRSSTDEPLKIEILQFIKSLSDKETNAHTAARIIKIVEKTYQSARTSRVVSL